MMNSDNLVNISAEKSVLCSMMLDNSLMVDANLCCADFYRAEHKVIYDAMVTLRYKNIPIDTITLSQQLQDTGELEKIGGLATILDISNSSFTTSGFTAHRNIVHECALKRELIRYVQEAEYLTENEDIDAAGVVDELLKKLSVITELSDDEFGLTSLFEKIDKEGAVFSLKSSGIPTNFSDYDKCTGGLHKGDLIILAARPAMGKSAFALNIARNLTFKQGKTVLFCSLEMSEEQIAQRIASSIAKISLNKIAIEGIDDSERNRIAEALKKRHPKGNLVVYEKTGCSPNEILRKARQLQIKGGLDLIIVDHIQLMQWDGKRTDNRIREITDISMNLKRIAKELQLPIIVLSQINRGVEGRQEKRPLLSDLRESGSIEQDADLVMFLYRDGYYTQDDTDKSAELIIAKNRQGQTKTIDLLYDNKTTTFLQKL